MFTQAAKDKVTVESNFSVDVIPEPIYQNLARYSTGVESLLDDLVIFTKLSVEDLACVLHLNSPCLSDLIKQGLCLSAGTRKSLDILRQRFGETDSIKSKIDAALRHSYTDAVKKQVRADLETYFNTDPVPNNLSIETSPPYQFVVTGTKIWLIVKQGFISFLEKSETRLKFYRDYLSTVATVAPFKELCQTDVYAHYVMEVLG